MLEQQWAVVFGALIILGGTSSVLLVMLNNTYTRIEDAIKLGTDHESRIKLLEDQVSNIKLQFKADLAEIDSNISALHGKIDHVSDKVIQIAAICGRLGAK